MFVTKTLEDPLRRVPLLAVNRAILFQNAVDDIRERRQLPGASAAGVADIPALPNATVSWQPSCGRSRTGEKLPVGSNPHDDTPVALVDKDPLRTSPTFHQVNPDKGYRRSHIGPPPQPDKPAASLGDYCSAVLIRAFAELGLDSRAYRQPY